MDVNSKKDGGLAQEKTKVGEMRVAIALEVLNDNVQERAKFTKEKWDGCGE